MDRIFLTTPIFYVNAEPHLGHTYTMVVVDTLARWWRSRGAETFFLTGTDEHGDKIEQTAAAAGETPKAFVDRISASFRSTWEECGFSFDHFIRTTDPAHERYVQEVLQRLRDKGEIFFGEYEGLYCTGCERFYTEKELALGRCPDHKTVPESRKEANYFFRMSRYQERLIAHLEANPDWARPERYRNELLGFLREPLEDLSISRPKSRLTWGIELPFDKEFVTYVWFDALLNYPSALAARGTDFFSRMWPTAQHVIGKDILKAHGVYWPTILMAADMPLYRHLNVHGHWTVEGQKMSKSLGNVIAPRDMIAAYGRDAFRYYVLREMVYGLDADFRRESLVARYNGDLANNLGNLVSRSLAMLQRYGAGEVAAASALEPIDAGVERAFLDAERESDEHLERLAFGRALEAIFRATDLANKYIAETAPFTLAKDPANAARVGTILRNLAEAIRRAAVLLSPFLPDTSLRIVDLLGFGVDELRRDDSPWASRFAPGHRVKPPVALFPRLEDPHPPFVRQTP